MNGPTGKDKRCWYCNRPLKSAESQRLGYGKDCGRKVGLLQPKARRTRAKVRRQLELVSRTLDQPPPPVDPGQMAFDLTTFHQPPLEAL